MSLIHRDNLRDSAISEARHARIVAGLCAIFLGAFGVHKFILGYTEIGLFMIGVLCITGTMAWPVLTLVGIVEGIIYLCKDDTDFYMTYIVQRRVWF